MAKRRRRLKSSVTAIQTIMNNYHSPVWFRGTEYPAIDVYVQPQSAGDPKNAWIPWCDSSQKFPEHHMSLKSDDGYIDYSIWQSGDCIYYWAGGYSAQARVLYPHIGIRVELAIGPCGELTMMHTP